MCSLRLRPSKNKIKARNSSELSRTDLKIAPDSRPSTRTVSDKHRLSTVIALMNMIRLREGWAGKEKRSCCTHPLCKVEGLLRHDEVIVAQYLCPSVDSEVQRDSSV